MSRRIVVVGAGIAGWSAVQAIRRLDKEIGVTVASEEGDGTYLRALLTAYIAGKCSEQALVAAGKKEYEALGAGLLCGRRVEYIDWANRQVLLEDGQALAYDGLLLATGANPPRPLCIAPDAPAVLGLRTLADARAIRIAAQAGARVCIVGAGPVGVKLAAALAESGSSPMLIERWDHLLPRLIDRDVASLLEGHLLTAGVETRTGVGICGVLTEGSKLVGVALDDRSVLPCDLAVYCTGVQPRTELVGAAPSPSHGVLVDDTQATSLPHVYAAGDAVESYDIAWGDVRVNAIWPEAVDQGRVAGFNLALDLRAAGTGAKLATPLRSGPSLARNAFDALGLAFCSMGVARSDGAEEVVSETQRRPARMKRLFFNEGRLVGAVLMGDVTEAGVLQARIRKEAAKARTREACGYQHGREVGGEGTAEVRG